MTFIRIKDDIHRRRRTIRIEDAHPTAEGEPTAPKVPHRAKRTASGASPFFYLNLTVPLYLLKSYLIKTTRDH